MITSGETLARVLPRMTSGLRAAGIVDPVLAALYASVYQAFRRRRSLLLLDLQKQVRMSELPWVAAIERFRRAELSERETCRQALREVTLLTLVAFPHAVVPNKLLQELRTLAAGAEADLPLVEEVAADIFMGRFSPKFVRAAKRAAELLDGTLYARYFGIDYDDVRRLPVEKEDGTRKRHDAPPDEFARLCVRRAGVVTGALRGGVAANGMIIEQQQVVTSQNLAVLVAELGLTEPLAGPLPGMARHCFEWVCARLQVKTDDPHAALIALKNAAYAWRQMVFYLALLPPAGVEEFLSRAHDHLGKQRDPFRTRFGQALRGLVLASEAHPGAAPSATPETARPFLGWTEGPHWLTG